MRKPHSSIVVATFLLLLSTLASAQISTPRPSQPPRHDTWLHTMEASMHAIRLPDAERTPLVVALPGPGVFAWLGWVVAFGFFMFLLSFHLKLRKKEKSLLRGSHDFFLLPPTGDRRRRAR